jgi:hypothetical protein
MIWAVRAIAPDSPDAASAARSEGVTGPVPSAIVMIGVPTSTVSPLATSTLSTTPA